MRIKEGIERLTHWCHCVLTYRQRNRLLDAKAFRDGVVHWSRMRKRLNYHFGDIKYIQTWERHKSGWPHVHLAISNVEIYKMCEYDKTENFTRLFEDHATSSGFGPRGSLEPIRTGAQMAGYLVKKARELTGGGKEYQIPTNAPPHFRRLRASRGVLPPILKNEDYTGELMEIDENGEIKERTNRK